MQQRSSSSSLFSFLGGVGLGAGAAYYLDPVRGHSRRVMLRDRTISAFRRQRELADKGARDLEHRAQGVVARTRQALRSDHPSDEKLVQRVRSSMGRVITHPGAIDVLCRDGRVILTGPVFANELQPLIRCVERVPGVREVENRLDAHDSADGVPGLQGEGNVPGRPIWMRPAWPPWMRLLATGGGAVAALTGLRTGGPIGTALTLAGGAALIRGTSNAPLRQLVSRRHLVLHKSIEIGSPVEEVFDFWSRFENFPRFMRHIRDVDVSEDGHRSHWRVHVPGGASLSWDAERTAYVPNEVISWRTTPGSPVEHAGAVHFESVDGSRTRLHIRMAYSQPVGTLGHAAAKLLGTDPKHAMDDDLSRLKTLLEHGKTRSPSGETVRVEELH